MFMSTNAPVANTDQKQKLAELVAVIINNHSALLEQTAVVCIRNPRMLTREVHAALTNVYQNVDPEAEEDSLDPAPGRG
ncbi:MAG: hypothetical protein A3J07_00345 [Candidatus Doudnabacteria bacterium RIFCSPLOWO2_02_FULL_49_13]|uniref:Uncharacterized protein n=1 Tax=Candidatus Doudnabacteria bacterium RIFCSPHIGHO2_12_FULL_48_16 TaxID=1817838 RepID=A0A1F5PIW9_9BACT|nr:MAG: hypothetical protein A3B77_00235 [Candidatus Doudnabacteria bacterium RIFCSPHIGHO2_02_FULL_49_24]OGE89557.1 MAG: hypothetical protein A2760_03495 [Candidatus Doudnabacteria bacterium RIFCSPHIGHO2_01_FULL_50_67]OGE89807.1 MAG: hypothetical protein A3E29_00265 [Candidatus Doudnabacteria bacterium RIFCSPHIGHO2_12_FULL_48_16]OGE97712.1 MAG: hypothetical protein A2990_00745 [Candidatus Doudnabacteria bacterium RIFCSPLOWO2_01_FULL_49_40]OGF02811.1 MAG: hypothetical protein A3J07_00345 [Candid